MNIKPLYDQVVIKRLEDLETTESGIVIPDTAKEKPSQGVVVAVGDGKLMSNGSLHPLMVKEGDKVLFDQYSGNEVQFGGEFFIVIREKNIYGIIIK